MELLKYIKSVIDMDRAAVVICNQTMGSSPYNHLYESVSN